MTAPEEDAIKGVWATMALAWEKGDARLFASVFDADVSFVSVRGEEQTTRDEVEQGHARLFATAYAGSRLEPDVRLIRPLGDDLALVHVTSAVLPADDKPAMTTHAQAVVRKRGESWSITAFHNMIPLGAPR
ncbi:SgcJ/EcaC family oxidoreductase [Amycolatopsis sp. cg5]|uniref:SgcJ/EcaC family oxidoreductase n=1 Tax=Amycolatopsis sp. cg5 TaxID=3238802 RepID=UPI00352622E5